jgi:enoyl-CoA hydratase/carnithine racemase
MATLRETTIETTPNNPGSAEKVQFTLVDNGTIGIIVLNDPELGNPMSPEMGDQFRATVGRTKTLKNLRAVIVRGGGQALFSRRSSTDAHRSRGAVYDRKGSP